MVGAAKKVVGEGSRSRRIGLAMTLDRSHPHQLRERGDYGEHELRKLDALRERRDWGCRLLGEGRAACAAHREVKNLRSSVFWRGRLILQQSGAEAAATDRTPLPRARLQSPDELGKVLW